jgi:hypothetical protein
MVDVNDINHISVELDDGWYVLKSPTAERLQGVSLLTWHKACREMRRRFQPQADLSQETIFRALDAIRGANQAAVIAAELGELQPTAEEIERDEGKLLIGWNEPQLPATAISLSDGHLENAEEFIPFTGPDKTPAIDSGSNPNEEAQSTNRLDRSGGSRTSRSPRTTDDTADWSEDD